MDTLALKVVATPVLIGAASLAGRRWGQGVSGWFVGLPLTSGPIALFLALDEGTSFAAAAAVGSLAGTIAQAAFSVVYARVAFRAHWIFAVAMSSLAFAVVGTVLQRAPLSLAWFLPLVIAILTLALGLMPRGRDAQRTTRLPRWDLPARMIVTTVIVLALTSAAPALGPRLSGLLATFPVYAGILTVFAHQQEGPAPAIQVLRGLLLGLYTFAGFFFVLGVTIDRFGIAIAFAAAILTALALHAASLRLVLPRDAASSP